MADENESGQEKTEQPTDRRVTEARKEGMVAKSYDLSSLLSLITAFVALKYLSPYLWENLIVLARAAFQSEQAYEPFTIDMLRFNFLVLLRFAAPHIALLVLITACVGVIVTGMQTKWNWSSKLFKPRLNLINPMAGFKRIFSIGNLVNLLKSLAKLLLIAPIAYTTFLDQFPTMLTLIDLPLSALLPLTAELASKIFWPIVKVLFIIAIIDYLWQRYTTNKRLKMSKQEVKDERKAVEGDESTKSTIRSKALERARIRMLQAVRTADVVVTNPTHIAVALKYTMEPGKAPIVVAKGQGFLAERIREIAREAGVPVIERKPLARALFKSVEVDHQIPYELYAAVADLLAYVYRLRGRNPFSRKQPGASQ